MEEYIQYHNPDRADLSQDEIGPYSIYTRKPAKSVHGARIWLVTRKRDTREYYLAYWFIAETTVPDEANGFQRVEGRVGACLQPPLRIDQEVWFEALLRYSGNFGLGLQRIDDAELAAGLRAAADVPPDVAFSHAQVFPLIARAILAAEADETGFVRHETIVSGLLADEVASAIVARSAAASAFADERAAASNMVAWFSQQITVGRSPWGEVFERQRRDGAWSYRPNPSVLGPFTPQVERAAIEGEPRWAFHLRRERSGTLPAAKRKAVLAAQGRLECEACGFVTDGAYRDLPGDVCEVHHRRPLAEAAAPVETTLDDLALLCANCHRAIHQVRPLPTIEEFRIRCLPSKPEAEG